MPYLVIKDYTLLIILVKHYGFVVVRQKGSHVRLSDGEHKITIAVHNRELKQGTPNSILRQA